MRGFSLAELLVCIAALIPVLLVLIGVFPFAWGIDHRAWERLDAQEIARAQIEQNRTADFDSLPATTSVSETRGAIQYQTTSVIDVFPTGQSPVVQKRCTITVTWQAKGGVQTFTIQTLLFKWATS